MFLKLNRAPFLAVVGLSLLACGGKQNTEAKCRNLGGGLSAEQFEVAAMCHAEKNVLESWDQCRAAAEFATDKSPAAVGALARCTLSAGERTDGAWLAELINAQPSDAHVLAILEATAGVYSADVHANTFSAGLTTSAQEAIARVLPQVGSDIRRELVSLALLYELQPLAASCGEYVRELPAEDPAVAAYARSRAESGETLTPNDQWALVTSGEWTAVDVIKCYRADQPGCEGNTGENALELLRDRPVPAGTPAALNAAVDVLQKDDVTEAEAQGLAYLLGNDTSEHGSSMLNVVLLDMTDDAVPLARRRGIARGAGQTSCQFSRVASFVLRSWSSDRDAHTNANSPWPIFLDACAENYWQQNDNLLALSFGHWLNAPKALMEKVRENLDAQTEELTCDDFLSLARLANDQIYRPQPYRLAFVEAANAAGDACNPTFEPIIAELANDNTAEAESRLAAIRWMVDHGDTSACGQIDNALRWTYPEYELQASEWANDLAQGLRSDCR